MKWDDRDGEVDVLVAMLVATILVGAWLVLALLLR
jgi:hypothetical protein